MERLIIKKDLNLSSKLMAKYIFNIFIISVFISTLLMRDLTGISINKFIFIGLACLLFIFNDKNFILGFICFLIPLTTGISYTYIIAFGLIIIIFKAKNSINIKLSSFFFLLIIFIIELVSSFIYGYFSFLDLFRFAPFMILITIIMSNRKENYNHELNLKMFIFGFFVMTIDLIGQTLQYYSISQFFSQGIRFGNTESILSLNIEGQLVSLNPNSLGIFAALVASISLLLYKVKNEMKYILCLSYSIIFGVMSQSRTFIIVLVIIILLYTLFNSTNIKKAGSSLIMSTLIVVIIIFIGNNLIPEYGEKFIERFTEVDDLTNGRNVITSHYYHEMVTDVKKLIIGVGIQRYNLKYNSIMSLHNATIELIAIWGIIGFLSVCMLFYDFFKNSIREHETKFNKVFYIPSIAFLIAAQSGQGFSIWSNILVLLVCYSSIRIGRLSNKNGKGDRYA